MLSRISRVVRESARTGAKYRERFALNALHRIGSLNRKPKFATTAAIALTLAAPALGGNMDCATCGDIHRTGAIDSVGLQIQELLRPVKFEQPKRLADSEINWDGGDKLPNAFERPWQMPYDKSFDPTFKTPYWTDSGGFINSPSAPWNLFLPPTLATRQFELGMALLGMPAVPSASFVSPAPTMFSPVLL